MDVPHLLVGLDIEVTELLPGRRAESLLEVRMKPPPASGSLVADLVTLIESPYTIGGVVLLVEVGQGRGEFSGHAVLLVEGDCLLEGLVAQRVAMGEVLSDDSRAGLIFLWNVAFVWNLGISTGFAAGDVVEGLRCGDVHGRRA